MNAKYIPNATHRQCITHHKFSLAMSPFASFLSTGGVTPFDSASAVIVSPNAWAGQKYAISGFDLDALFLALAARYLTHDDNQIAIRLQGTYA